MQINNLLRTSVPDIYTSDEFINIIEDHLPDLLTNINNTVVAVDEQIQYKYVGDFYGLLSTLGVDKRYQYVVLRVNGYISSSDFNGDRNVVTLPNLKQVETLVSVLKTRITQ